VGGIDQQLYDIDGGRSVEKDLANAALILASDIAGGGSGCRDDEFIEVSPGLREPCTA
jgi:hypothetical protein